MTRYNEDTLVQQTTADYLRDVLGWETVNAYYEANAGLGRGDEREVVLTLRLRRALEKLNPGLPEVAYQEAVRQLTATSVTQSLVQLNQAQYGLVRDGVLVTFQNPKGESETRRLRVIDFEKPEENEFLAVRELWVKGAIYRRRADIVGFVNGLPLLFMELKTIYKDLRAAYEGNLADYKDTIPHLFHHNAVIVLGNGVEARIGSLTSRFEHFHEWKRLEEDDPGVVDMETLLKGICEKGRFLDLVENFIVFDESSGRTVKIVARNHQVLGVNRAVKAVEERRAREGKLGVFWHTQGSGKSYSMVFLARKVHRRLGGNFTFLICTDREDLDTQIYKTFAGCGLVSKGEPARPTGGDDLKRLLGEHRRYVFTLIQKFNKLVKPGEEYSKRDDIIVISDEAHRTQYGQLALNMRSALPNASYMGFTGTPLFQDDEITRRVFGDYISTYDFQRAVEDGATVPLYYDARGEKLGIETEALNERIAAKLEELEVDPATDVGQVLQQEMEGEYLIMTAPRRLQAIANDFVHHYASAWETGKAMIVCIDKLTCVRLHHFIQEAWKIHKTALEKGARQVDDEQEEIYRRRQVQWMDETQMAVVVSEEQGEVERFRKAKLDIIPHRRLIKEGFETADGKRIDVESAFKQEEHPFRVAIVCAMWLTGFDVPSLSTLYLDKPLKAHTLMQAIARANRVHQGKNNGLIVDYCGIVKHLRLALATFASHRARGVAGEGPAAEVDPTRPETDLLADVAKAIEAVRVFLETRRVRLDDLVERTGFARNKALREAKEAVNENDETRQRFDRLAREVFKKYRAALPITGSEVHKQTHEAISFVYKSLQADLEQPDLTEIVRELQGVVDAAITIVPEGESRESALFDLSKIDFDRLRQAFEQSATKYTTVQAMKAAINARLTRMLQQNTRRIDWQQRYEEIVADYNREKDRATIDQTFAALWEFAQKLEAEAKRAEQAGLDEESLAIYDLLVKPELSLEEIERLKQVAAGVLKQVKTKLATLDRWEEKEATRDDVKAEIGHFLWNEETGLPTTRYTDAEVDAKAELVYLHVFRVYRWGFTPVYEQAI